MVCGVLVGNSIVHIGYSSPSPGARINGGLSYPGRMQSQSRHAEMDALRYFRRHDVRKAQVVVIRRTRKGDFGNSRPCIPCIQRILRYHRNITSVTYFESGQWYMESPASCSISSKLSSGDRLKLMNSSTDK